MADYTYDWQRRDPVFFKAGSPLSFWTQDLISQYNAFPPGFLDSYCFNQTNAAMPKPGYPFSQKNLGFYFLEGLDPDDFADVDFDNYTVNVSIDFKHSRLSDPDNTFDTFPPGFLLYGLTDIWYAGYSGDNYAFNDSVGSSLTNANRSAFIPALADDSVTISSGYTYAIIEGLPYPEERYLYTETDTDFSPDYTDTNEEGTADWPDDADLGVDPNRLVVLFQINVSINPQAKLYVPAGSTGTKIITVTMTNGTFAGWIGETTSYTVTYNEGGTDIFMTPNYKSFRIFGLTQISPATKLPSDG